MLTFTAFPSFASSSESETEGSRFLPTRLKSILSSSTWGCKRCWGHELGDLWQHRLDWKAWGLNVFSLMFLFILWELCVIFLVNHVVFLEFLVVPVFPSWKGNMFNFRHWEEVFHMQRSKVYSCRLWSIEKSWGHFTGNPCPHNKTFEGANQALHQTFISSSFTIVDGTLDVRPGMITECNTIGLDISIIRVWPRDTLKGKWLKSDKQNKRK